MEKVIERKKGMPEGLAEIWLAGGCFWGAQKYLEGIRGVVSTSVGYANSRTASPTYQEVCSHATGAAETVHVCYDSTRVSLGFLLSVFFKAIDPTSINQQGGDVGEQYRTGIYYTNEADAPAIHSAMDTLARSLPKPVTIEVLPLVNYYLAEEYHQDYLKKNPEGYCHISDAMCKAAAQESEET